MLLPPNKEGVARASVQLHSRGTLYSRWPDRGLLLMLPMSVLLSRVQPSR